MDRLNIVRAVTELIDGGGPFVAWIFVCGIVLWTLVIERLWFFRRILPDMASELHGQWMARRDHTSWCARQIRDMMISKLNAAMTANLQILNVLVPLSPLLGLIGTVSGMLEVFDSMALRGSADARTHGERRLPRDDLHDDRPRGEHHRASIPSTTSAARPGAAPSS